MNADPFRPLPTREDYAADLGQWPDMAQMPEPEPARKASVLPTVMLGAAIVLACALAVWGLA